MSETLLIIIGGAVGALIKEILEDNSLKLPAFLQGKLDLGFFGSVIIGAFVGYVVDGGFLTAAMGGFAGFSIIQNLVPANIITLIEKEKDVKTIIIEVCKGAGIDPELALKVAKCESNLNPKAVHVNEAGSIDRGLFQINSKYHPEVTEAQAFNPAFSTQFFCDAFKSGNLSWWNASRKCWDK